jgi:hypothetical protein
MVFILSGQLLLKQFNCLTVQNINCLQKKVAARKNVERAVGVLQARFAILRGLARFWNEETLADIMYACIILHNMIVEDERDSYQVRFNDNEPYDIMQENEHYEQGSSWADS